MHVRQQILEAAVALVTGLPTTGQNVFRSRLDPLQRTELPALVLSFAPNSEDAAPATAPAPRLFERLCRIQVSAVVRTSADYDRELNQACLEVEKALAMPVAGPWKVLTLARTDIQMTGSGEQPLCEAAMLYEASYVARENAPDTAL